MRLLKHLGSLAVSLRPTCESITVLGDYRFHLDTPGHQGYFLPPSLTLRFCEDRELSFLCTAEHRRWADSRR